MPHLQSLGSSLPGEFETVVVAGDCRVSLKVASKLGTAFLPVWKATGDRKRGISGGLAPLALIGSFNVALPRLAFGIAHAFRAGPQYLAYVDALAEHRSKLRCRAHPQRLDGLVREFE